jgi:molybdenum cofactor guanylyltransferase
VDFPMIEAEGQRIDPFFNVNTPDDLAVAKRLLQRLQR